MKKIILAVKFLCMVLIVVGVYMFFDSRLNNEVEVVEVINEIKEYGYSLNDNETELYNGYFHELQAELDKEESDEELYASLVTKLFLSDFYNLDNKVTNNDIGGVQFIENSFKDNFILTAKNTIYKYIENNLDDSRDQQLPVVTDVTIAGIYNKSFSYNGTTDSDAYEVEANIVYENDYGYQTSVKVILIHQDKKLVIVELN